MTPTQEAIEQLDAYLSEMGGCSDGGCIIKRPVGMHTNGGCHCSRDSFKMQRYAYAMNRFASSVRLSAACEPGEEYRRLFSDLFDSPNFQVSIGGNPILVERMLDRIDEMRGSAISAFGGGV